MDRPELTKAWEAETKDFGINKEELIVREAARESTRSDTASRAERALDYAVEHHRERNSIYGLSATINTALERDQSVRRETLERVLADRIVENNMFLVKRPEGRFLTDSRTVALERENAYRMQYLADRPVLDMRTAAQKLTTRTSDSAVLKRLDDTTLTPGQRDAVALSLSSHSGVVGVQGYAGTGKTYMLATVERMAKSRGYAVDGVAPSHKAVTALGEAIPNSATVQSLLTRFEAGANLGDKSKTILVVDEASMLGAETMNRILRMSHAAGYARTVLVGDIKQLDAVEAGAAFRALQAAGMRTAIMSDIQRQDTLEGRQTVIAAIRGDIKTAMEGVTKITETGGKDREEIRSGIADKLAEIYAGLSPQERPNRPVIVGTNAMRRDINESVQGHLRAAGELGGGQMDLQVLASRGFTQAEASDVASYRVDDLVMSPVASSKSGLKSGVIYKVTGTNLKDETLNLQGPDGTTVTLDMDWKNRTAQKLQVFRRETQTFIEGDRVQFKITDRENGIFNATEGVVSKAGTSSYEVTTTTGEKVSLPTDSLGAQGMQLAYAFTAHNFQGSDAQHPLIGMASNELLANQKNFYVSLSRMRAGVELVTDDAAKLTSRIESETGERINALEALKEDRQRPVTPLENREAPALSDRPDATRDAIQERSEPDQKAVDKRKDQDTKTEAFGFDKETFDKRMAELDAERKELLERDQKTRDERSR